MSSVSRPSSNPSFTVLRIKRKATEAPLSSLVIQDEPDSRAKKRRDIRSTARGVFRLAETVPDTWQGSGEEGTNLRDRIRRLLSKQRPSRDGQTAHLPPKSVLSQTLEPPEFKRKGTVDVNSDSASTTANTCASTRASTSASTIKRSPDGSSTPNMTSNKNILNRRLKPTPQVQYRVVPPTSPRTKHMFPPRVMTYAEENTSSPLTFVDAEAVAGPSISSSLPDMNASEAKDMAAFLPMLEEYLKLESQPSPRGPTRASRQELSSDSEKYVYDLYYRDIPSSGTSTPLGLGVGDGVHIGALLGYDDHSPTSSPSASEPEDEADEDSNDENFYRNDYPEDEDADEDMMGYRDAFDDDDDDDDDDDEQGRDGGSDEGGDGDGDERERGTWDYR